MNSVGYVLVNSYEIYGLSNPYQFLSPIRINFTEGQNRNRNVVLGVPAIILGACSNNRTVKDHLGFDT